MAELNNNKWRLLNNLKTFVKKLTLLINSNGNSWPLSASTGGGGGASHSKLSFGEQFGLTAIVSSSDEEEESGKFCGSCCSSSTSSRKLEKTNSFRVQRTTSFREEDDVDKRAELFIQNFHRRLRYEKQVSLELSYARAAAGTSFGSSDSYYSP